MTSDEYIKLYKKYISGRCTPEEEQRLFEYEDSFKLQVPDAVNENVKEDKLLRRQIYSRIEQTITTKKVNIFRLWFRYAATVLVILSVGVTMYLTMSRHEEKIPSETVLKTIPVTRIDSTVAILTLADGSVIPLDETGNGLLTHEGSTEIRKTKDGELVYDVLKEHRKIDTAPNRISIPKGRQYKLTLADGTKVWLNSASTLVYPSSFAGNERHVELSGEAYFEVAKNEAMPFTVTANGVKVKVLGTQFNVSAYSDDEFIKTTLAEGSVSLSNNNNDVVLKPGQQGVAAENTERIAVRKVNLQQALAWKEGYFVFQDEDLKDVMKQISRWYNVDVEYEAAAKEKSFGGIYSRSKDLEELLKGLELTGTVKFRVEGRRVLVID